MEKKRPDGEEAGLHGCTQTDVEKRWWHGMGVQQKQEAGMSCLCKGRDGREEQGLGIDKGWASRGGALRRGSRAGSTAGCTRHRCKEGYTASGLGGCGRRCRRAGPALCIACMGSAAGLWHEDARGMQASEGAALVKEGIYAKRGAAARAARDRNPIRSEKERAKARSGESCVRRAALPGRHVFMCRRHRPRAAAAWAHQPPPLWAAGRARTVGWRQNCHQKRPFVRTWQQRERRLLWWPVRGCQPP